MRTTLSLLPVCISFAFLSSGAQASVQVCRPPVVSEGNALATQAIQHAIDQCSQAGGGRVELSAGVWQSGPLLLKDNVELYLAAGSRLTASYQGDAFKPGFISAPAHEGEAFILAKDVNNIAIAGPGVIDGQGQQRWWPLATEARNHLKHGDTNWFTQHYPGIPTANGMPRPWLIEFANVSQGKISGIGIENSPMWNLVIRDSHHIEVTNSTITNPSDSPNTDGIDIISSRQVHLHHLNISTGDDNISVKSGLAKRADDAESRDITIDHIQSENGHGISIGSETINGIGKVTLQDLHFTGTENGVRIKSGRDRGANIGPVIIRNVTMQQVKTPLVITDSYGGNGGYSSDSVSPIKYQTLTTTTPNIHDVTLQHIEASGATHAGIISGLPEAPLKNIHLESVHITAKTGLQSRYVSGWQKQVAVDVQDGEAQLSGNNVDWVSP